MPQTTVSASPVRALAGLIAHAKSPDDILSAVVDQAAGIAPGLVLLHTSGGDNTASTQPATAAAADDDAIHTALATSSSTQTITTGDGVVGLGRIFPAQKLTITRSSHGDQDAVSAVLTYFDLNGVKQTQTFSFANAGGDSFTSTYEASYFVSLVIPAQSGTGGTTKIGIEGVPSLAGGTVMGVSVLSQKTVALAPTESGNEVYGDQEVMPYIRHGYVWVSSETDFFVGQQPFVRLVASGIEVYGAIRTGDSDSGDAFLWSAARFVTHGLAGELGKLAINL
jgi:hypothetical protein